MQRPFDYEHQKPQDYDLHKDFEDKAGGYIDNPSEEYKNIHEAESNDKAVRLELNNSGDVSYLGPIFIGLQKEMSLKRPLEVH